MLARRLVRQPALAYDKRETSGDAALVLRCATRVVYELWLIAR